MKNVYVVIEHYVYESASEIIVNVYANKELAKSAFKEVVEREKERSWINQREYITEEESEEYYKAYMDGRACEYETTIEIQEKLIWE